MPIPPLVALAVAAFAIGTTEFVIMGLRLSAVSLAGAGVAVGGLMLALLSVAFEWRVHANRASSAA